MADRLLDLPRPEDTEPETRAFLRWLAKETAGKPRLYERSIAAIRAEIAAGEGQWGLSPRLPQVQDRLVAANGRQASVSIYVPAVVHGVCLELHGGGFCLGQAHQSDDALVDLADRLSLAIVSVNYRLAPEHPYPAALDDCTAAAAWLLANARYEFGCDRLVLSGTSAGANLGVGTLVRLRVQNGVTGFAGASFEYGCYSLPPLPSMALMGEDAPVLSPGEMMWLWRQYAPAGLERHPEVSPVYADLRGLPPALFTVGTADPLLDDSVLMAYRWAAAGNAAELALYAGCPHAFTAFPFPAADRANARIESFLLQCLAST